MGTGAGVPDIPYDRTAMEVPVVDPTQRPELQDEQLPEEGMGMPPADPGQAMGGLDSLSGLGAGGESEAIPTEELAGMVSADPDAVQGEELIAALEDPNTPPEIKAQIQEMLATAARRRMAGIMGGV
jgi:hypothetical protein